MIPSFASEMAHWAVVASWAAALPALVLLALGEWRSFSVRWRWFLGLVVAVRLAVPRAPGLAWHPLAYFQGTQSAAPVSAETFAPAAAATTVGWWSWLWLAGCLTVIAWLVLSQCLLWRRILRNGVAAPEHLQEMAASCLRQAGVSRRVDLRMVPELATPAVFGVWRPCLLLPLNIEENHSPTESRGILLHEVQHIRSHDALWTWAGLLLCALHWFNPLAWLCLRRFRADRELMCDERTLRLLTPMQRTAYARALIKTWENVSQRQPALLTPFLRRNSATYHRILMSLQPHKTTSRIAHFLALALVPALSLFSLTTVKADGDAPRKSPEAEKGTKGEGETPKAGKKQKSKRGRGEGEGARKGTRDGEGAAKPGTRDGEGGTRSGARDGDGAAKKGPRDGEGK